MTDVDATLDALADERRRHAVRALVSHRSLTLADLAEIVAEREVGSRLAALPAGRVADTYFSLYHDHVPALEAADLARYDQATDRVEVTDEARRAVDRARDELASIAEDVTNRP